MIVNLASERNYCCGLFQDIPPCVSDCFFPACENKHRFSRWANGTVSPSIGIAACGVYLTEPVAAVHIRCLFSGKYVHEFAPSLSPPVVQLYYLYLGKSQSQCPWSARTDHPWEILQIIGVSYPHFHAVTSGRWAREVIQWLSFAVTAP